MVRRVEDRVLLATKMVIVLSEGLALAEAVNAAAVLGLSANADKTELGAEGVDAAELRYGCLDRHPVPVLVADQAQYAIYTNASPQLMACTWWHSPRSRAAHAITTAISPISLTPRRRTTRTWAC